MEQGEIILYQPDEAVKLEVRLEDETVWLTQEQIADLFGTKRPAITKHLNNIYKSGELDIDSTCSILEHMGNDGKDDPAYSLAIIKWENTYKLGIRWNIAYSEWDDYRKQNGQDECIGNPQSRGIPTWFVLPDDMMFGEKFSGAMQRLDELRKGK